VKVLVLGGSAFNGRALVRQLVGAGHEVAVLNRGRTPVEFPAGVERLTGDRTQPETLRAALAGRSWDAVFDLTGYRADDVRVTAELLDGTVGHYLFASSMAIYARCEGLPIDEDHPLERGPAQSDYGLGKIACEEALFERHARTGFPATVVVLPMVFGPHNIIPDREQRMFARLSLGRPILVPGEGHTRGQVVHVEDAARAWLALCGLRGSFGRRYNVIADEPFTDLGYVAACAQAMGVEPRIVHVPRELMDALWDGRREVALSRSDIRIDTRPTARDAVLMRLFNLSKLVQRGNFHLHRWDEDVLLSSARLRAQAGWAPQFTFEGAAADTWRWYEPLCAEARERFDFGFEDQILEMLPGAGA
jgi:nucleoside-diphosphate-sugar epimerase